jgi:DNA-binding response OmpR family regulator
MDYLSILIVEDELLTANLLSDYLKKQNYNIIGIVQSGEAAIDLIKFKIPDIILMDINLDGKLDGIETTALIHKEHHIPVIYLSQFQDDKTLKRATNTIPAIYLTKPFKNIDVRNAIELLIKNVEQYSKPKLQTGSNTTYISNKEIYPLNNKIFIKNNYGTFSSLNLDDVVYIKTNDHQLILHTISGERKAYYVFTRFLEFINFYPVFRIHKGIAINANYVIQYSKNEVIVEYIDSNGNTIVKTLPIGNSFKENTINNFRNYRHLKD